MNINKNIKNQEAGFTLVELAIVLVIIGLIIGGVLVGQDMIKSAEVRSTISQYEKFNTALNVFRDKYSGFPGDMRNPANFGFNVRGSANTSAGNGRLEDCAATDVMFVGCENAAFFEDLSIANLVPDNNVALAALLTANHTNQSTAGMLPEASIGNGTVFSVYANGGLNWFHLSGTNDSVAGPGLTDTIEPIEAFNIDDKIDDGVANEGVVQAASTRGANITVAGDIDGTAGDCLLSATVYNTDVDSDAITPSCQLMLRMN